MKIETRTYLYKVITPSTKLRVLTKWTEESPIEEFEFFERVKVPLAVTDTEINNTYREITKTTAKKLMDKKLGTNSETEEVQENPNEE